MAAPQVRCPAGMAMQRLSSAPRHVLLSQSGLLADATAENLSDGLLVGIPECLGLPRQSAPASRAHQSGACQALHGWRPPGARPPTPVLAVDPAARKAAGPLR